jgi:3-dehydroquinate synthetase
MAQDDLSTIRIEIGRQSFDYHFGYNCLDQIVARLAAYQPDCFLVVTDDTVAGLHGEMLFPALRAIAPTHILSRPPGEAAKSMTVLQEHLEQALSYGATRRSVVIAFGGGVPGNLAGTIAGLLFRGVRLVHLPTTTVAAMDSVLSLKQAVNSSVGKNHFGLYKVPEAVYVDVRMLQTLPSRELRSGLSEFVKNALAIRPEILPRVREVLSGGELASAPNLLWMLEESVAAKLAVMRSDPYEQGMGLVLEYGHTVGHAVELCDFRRRGSDAISHGEAIALGGLAAARLSQELGHLDADAAELHAELVRLLGGPATIPAGISEQEIVTVVRADNKRGYLDLKRDEAAFVLLSELGRPLGDPRLPLVPVPLDLVSAVVTELGAAPM